jgi:hypothetical protein
MAVFSVVTTAKNENKKVIEETFQNWEVASDIFEKKTNKKIEFIVVDAGQKSKFPKFDLLKSLLYAAKWFFPYFYPDAFKYRKHVFSV